MIRNIKLLDLKVESGVRKLIESGEKIKPRDLDKVFPKENES